MRNNYLFGKSGRVGRYFVVCLFILGEFWTSQSNAQITAANYTFSTNATGSLGLDMNGNVVDMTTGTTTLVAAGVDVSPDSPITNITFNFTLVSTTYSQFSVSSNGMLWLGATSLSGYVMTNATAATPVITALCWDMRTFNPIISKVVGTAPNRCLVVQ